jgi:hypothetical protein
VAFWKRHFEGMTFIFLTKCIQLLTSFSFEGKSFENFLFDFFLMKRFAVLLSTVRFFSFGQ